MSRLTLDMTKKIQHDKNMFNRSNIFAIALVLCAVAAHGVTPRFTYDDIAEGKFRQQTLTGVHPMNGGEHYAVQDSTRITAFRYSDGGVDMVVFDGAEQNPRVEFKEYIFSPNERKVLLATNVRKIYRHSMAADWLLHDRLAGTITPLSAEGGEQQPAFSPDGTKVAFVRDNDLYVVDLESFTVRRITEDGARNSVINGLPDWVYEEEYGMLRAFCFSPDGHRIAWLRFDESRVRQYTLLRYRGQLYPEAYTYKYPKAGEENSDVQAWMCDLEKNVTARANVDTRGLYVPRLGFTPEGELWLFCVNRKQNRFQVVIGGRTAYEENSSTYIERPDERTATFLAGGRMVVMNESSGSRQLYLYERRNGKYSLKNAVTKGKEVLSLVEITTERAYYLTVGDTPMQRELWSVRLDGREAKRLTTGKGVYKIEPGRYMHYFLSYFSNSTTPLRVTVNRGVDGTQVRTIEDNAALAAYTREVLLPAKEFFTFKTVDGTDLNGYMVKPAGFDPSRRYPVLMTQYSGPGSQEVLDRWKVDWEDVMVQYGYVVVCVDGRGTGGRGAAFRKCTYGQLGKLEVQDQLAAARWIGAQPWADASRIGIYGWSYGGFMALNCATQGPGIFKMAIAVASVTSWRYYDTIYTEIYNGLPQENPAGYDDNSPLTHAAALDCKLLMIHGSSDDNVHPQNSYEMASALMRAGKQFDFEVYPDCNHSMLPGGRNHIRQRMVDFTLANL